MTQKHKPPTERPSLGEQFYMVVLCQGNRVDGQPFWAYLQVPTLKAKAFKKAQAKGAFQLEDFGEIIEWGLGANVSPDVRERMEREHCVNHDFEDLLKLHLKKSR